MTGAPRSGTTWVGASLARAPGVGYIHEPFNRTTPAGICTAEFEHSLQYVFDDDGPQARALERTLRFDYALGPQVREIRSPRELGRSAIDFGSFMFARLGGRRPLVKDPIAVFSSEWLARRFEMDVVVVIRHPAAVVASFKRLNWRHRLESFLEQPELMDAYLRPYERELRDQAGRPEDTVGQAALLWKLVHHTISVFQERHPDWIFVRHEDLAPSPVAQFAPIFQRLGLEFTDQARRAIERDSSAANPKQARHRHDIKLDSSSTVGAWRRTLSPEEVRVVRAKVGDVGSMYYSEDEW